MSDLQPCVVCDSADFEPLKSASWNFTGLGALNVTFGICKDCGHVSQDPFPTSELITAFYEQNVNYYEPDYNMELPAEPVSTRRRILALARRFKPEMGTVLEIGCGSGENLHYFKQEGWDAYGCEPSFQSGKQAQTRIGEDKITIGFADDALVSNMKYDVVFSSHVLEHVTDPKKMFGQIVNSAKDDGIVIVEVPCTRQPERLSPGWLALEHLTYFSAGGITRMAEDAGLQVIETVMDDEYHLYPAVCIVCRKPCADTKNELTYFNEYAQNRHCVAEFLKKDAKHWADVGSRIAEFDDIYLWGAGNHTAQLFVETDVKNTNTILGIVDSSPIKTGKQLDTFTVMGKQQFLDDYNGQHVVIVSYFSENEIAESLKSLGVTEDRIVRLYAPT